MILSDIEKMLMGILGDLSEVRVADEYLEDFIRAKRRVRALLYRIEIEKLLDAVPEGKAEQTFAIVREALKVK